MDNIEIDKIDKMLSEFRLIDIQINNKLKVIYSKYEVWRTIKNENYSVSSFGRVRNNKTDRIMKPFKDKDGYYCLSLYKNGKGKHYKVNRLVGINFLLNYDEKPIVDHIDRKEITNNNILNLRWATCSQKIFNKDKRKDNASGFKGVQIDKRNQKYRARINIKGKQTHLGSFLTAEEASKAYETKAKEIHGEFFYKNK